MHMRVYPSRSVEHAVCRIAGVEYQLQYVLCTAFSYEEFTAHSRLNHSSHRKEEWSKTDPLAKEGIHSVSQKIIRLPQNQKHIHLIRKMISNVLHGLDEDSRWTCRWTSYVLSR